MKINQWLLGLSLSILIGCKSKPDLPTFEEATQILQAANFSDTNWQTFPKRYYLGGASGITVEGEKEQKRNQIARSGQSAGVWNMEYEEIPTGSSFFSVPQTNNYIKIVPSPSHQHLFFDNPKNNDEWRVILSIVKFGTVQDILIEKTEKQDKETDSKLVFYNPIIDKTPLYNVFEADYLGKWNHAAIIKKINGKWSLESRITTKGSAQETRQMNEIYSK